jgi:ATP-dependent RNA helicase DHX36
VHSWFQRLATQVIHFAVGAAVLCSLFEGTAAVAQKRGAISRPTKFMRGGGFRGGRGGGGGGQQRWWDPEWRAQKLASMGAGGGGRDRLQVDHAEWRQKLEYFLRGEEKELQCRDNYGREGVEEIHRLAAEQGLYSKAYGKGRNTVLVVSREPLPNYRADLDAKLEGRVQHVEMSSGAKAMVKDVLARLPDAPPQKPQLSQSLQHQQQSAFPCTGANAADIVPDTWDADDTPSEALAPSQGAQGAPGNVMTSPQLAEKSVRLQRDWQERQEAADFKRMMAQRQRLPSFAMREQLLHDMRHNRVLVVSGETGCGKTTQVPQFILDDMDACGLGAKCSIICTQPRRISAMSGTLPLLRFVQSSILKSLPSYIRRTK